MFRPVSLLILTIVLGCDNVNWGGADVTVVPPPPKATMPSASQPSDEPGDEPLPQGPVVYYVARTAEGAVMVPVGEVVGDSLRPVRARRDARLFAERFITEHMRQGSEFVLFRAGLRVGTLLVQSASAPPGDACTTQPRALGTLELSAQAAGATEFLALSQLQAPQVPRRLPEPMQPTRTMTFVAPILAERMLRRRRAQLPSNWQRAMAQVTPIPVFTGQQPGFAATFLVGDTLGPGLDDMGTSLFFLAVPSAAQVGWDTVYVDFRNYPDDGKGAARVIDFLDWDRDDHVELLLQVYGVSESWFEAVGRGPNAPWRRVLSDRCPAEGETPRSGSTIPVPLARPDTTRSS